MKELYKLSFKYCLSSIRTTMYIDDDLNIHYDEDGPKTNCPTVSRKIWMFFRNEYNLFDNWVLVEHDLPEEIIHKIKSKGIIEDI